MNQSISRRIIFFLFDGVHLLDLAGPVTVFYESGYYGKPYELLYVSYDPSPITSSGLGFTAVAPLNTITITQDDVLIVAGMNLNSWNRDNDYLWITWLQEAAAIGATICSICTAAFALAAAGLLNNHPCTTHWAYTAALQKQYPSLKVVHNKLFVKSGNLYTSAGITTGIDLALYLIEEQHGAAFAYTVAKDMVVYIRRDGHEPQDSIYLQYRQHINHHVHQVKDHIIHHLHQKITISELAALIYTSPRSITRLFKSVIGITIGEYIRQLRLEKAQHLLKAQHKVAWVAQECGYKNANQLRDLIKHASKLS